MVRILLVDDNTDYLHTSALLLRKIGKHQVTTAKDLGQALLEARTSTYDVLITDKNLGGHRGVIPLLEFMKEERPETNVVINSGEPITPGLRELYHHRFSYKPESTVLETLSELGLQN